MTEDFLFVDGTAVGATSLAVDLLPTVATDIWGTDACDILINGESDVCHQEEVTYEGMRDGGEEKIIERAHAEQAQQVDDGLHRFKMVERVVDRCDGQHQNQPHQPQEDGQGEGVDQGIEQRMEIEVPPHLRVVLLDM